MSFYAFKGFDKDLKCRDFQYEVGKTYSIPEKPEICERGFHCCLRLIDAFEYYPPISWENHTTDSSVLLRMVLANNRHCLVEVLGDIDSDSILGYPYSSKIASNKIKIVRELTYSDLKNILNEEINDLKRYFSRSHDWLKRLSKFKMKEDE